MPFLEGFLIGLGTVIFIGPVLFTLLQISLDHGYKAGLSVALGIIVSDILIVALFYLGLIDFFTDEAVQFWLAIAGSAILFGLGLKYILKPYTPKPVVTKPSLANISVSFSKGFLVNFVNPFVFMVWLSIVSVAKEKFDAETDVQVFLVASLVGIFATDALKVLLAGKLQKILNPKFLKKLFRLIGLILIGFGIRLLFFIAS